MHFFIPRVDCQRHASLATTSSEGTRTADDSVCNCILAHLCMLLSVLALRWVVANLYITLIGWLLCSKGMTWAGEIDC